MPRDRLRRLVEAAQRGLARGAQLTRQLLVLSRQEPLEARIVDVNAAITDFASLIQRAIGETIELRLELGDGGWPCKLDPAQFEAAILNLAINAKDATEGGGRLTIRTELVRSAEEAGGAVELTTPHIVLTVADTGSGMSPEVAGADVRAVLHDKAGRQGQRPRPGAGLGLRHPVRRPDRRRQRTRRGHHLPDLPAALAGARRRGRRGTPVQARSRAASERILVVEDEEEVRDVASATLERLGYRIVAARDGREALAILDERGDFDLLFTDYVMPGGLNGAAVGAARRAAGGRA